MKIAAIVFAASLFATVSLSSAGFAQSQHKSEFDDVQIQRSIDSAVAQLDSLDKDGKLSEKISKAVDEAMKKAGGVLAEAQKELGKAENQHAIDSAMKQSAEVMKESKAALKAAAKALKNSDAIKHAGQAFDEAAKAFEKAMQDFEKEFDKQMDSK
jgi:hypothetical protein